MAAVTVFRKLVLLPPKPLRPEAQPDPARSNVSFQHLHPVPQVGQPTPLLMNLIPSAAFSGIENLPLSPGNPPLQVVQPHLLLLSDRRHLPLQRNPHAVEHPRRYPVSLQVGGLQRRRGTSRRNVSKQLPLHPAIQLTVCCQHSIASRTAKARVIGNARLVCAKMPHQPSRAAASARSARRRAERRP